MIRQNLGSYHARRAGTLGKKDIGVGHGVRGWGVPTPHPLTPCPTPWGQGVGSRVGNRALEHQAWERPRPDSKSQLPFTALYVVNRAFAKF
jgi:hypothetical protein